METIKSEEQFLEPDPRSDRRQRMGQSLPAPPRRAVDAAKITELRKQAKAWSEIARWA